MCYNVRCEEKRYLKHYYMYLLPKKKKEYSIFLYFERRKLVINQAKTFISFSICIYNIYHFIYIHTLFLSLF